MFRLCLEEKMLIFISRKMVLVCIADDIKIKESPLEAAYI
jgi:hypothetical protein